MKRTSYVIGTGPERYEFPIVRTGNVRKHSATLYVNAESFRFALAYAINWAKDYSENIRQTSKEGNEEFWPSVIYKSITGRTRAYVRRMDHSYAYVEGSDYGYWIPLVVLEAV